ncbi:MAG: cupin domain-containing protein [Actinobacteria bacterium]|nr:cupin domain-containing protein [Actinomycetota bacterium]
MNLRDAELTTGVDKPGFRHRRASVREKLGGELIGCSLYEFDPGEQLWPYHWHRNNEEWLIVVAGTPTLRMPDGERELRPGDVVGFPEGEDGAHTLYNRGDTPARVAIFSTLRKGSTVYPDSGKVGVAGQAFRSADAVDYWEGEL